MYDGGILRNGDVIVHRVHRHEPPILDTPVEVIDIADEFVAVCKPASMPVHACGQYRLNTLLGWMEREYKHLMPLYANNRLDVPVSGVVVLARSSEASRRMCTQMEGRRVRKLYIARVAGNFLDVFSKKMTTTDSCVLNCKNDNQLVNCADNDVDIIADEKDNVARAEHDRAKVYECEVPLGYDPSTRRAFVAELKPNENVPSSSSQMKDSHSGRKPPSTRDKNGKRLGSYAKTKFKFICSASDGLSSIVLCEPVTGRTHQIRIHLAHIGFPIMNDKTYNEMIPSSLRVSEKDMKSSIHSPDSSEVQCPVLKASNGEGDHGRHSENNNSDNGSEDSLCHQTTILCSQSGKSLPKWSIDHYCPHCPFLRSPDFDSKPPQVLWLHAMHYSSENLFEYSCAPPPWAERERWPSSSSDDMFGINHPTICQL